jgi:predicted MFS family arabinose efflux permease
MLMLAAVAFASIVLIPLFGRSLGPHYVAMALIGAVHGAVWPARGALIPRLVDAPDLARANGMVGAARELPMAVGPALAAVLLRLWGRGVPYLVAIVGMAAAVALYAMVPDRRVARREERTFLGDLAVGVRRGMRVPVLRLLFVIGFCVMFVFGLFQTLETPFVQEVLRRGQDALGFLWSVQGIGAFAGSLSLVWLRRASGAEVRVTAAGVLFAGLGIFAYAAFGADSWAVALGGGFLFGLGWAVYFAMSQALIQRISDDPGKVSAVFIVIGEVGPLLAALGIGIVGTLDVQAWLIVASGMLLVFGLAMLWSTTRPAFLVEESVARR